MLATLGYRFKDAALVGRALDRSGGLREYQRLEFLGDRVLGLVVGAWLFDTFPEADEGELSRRLTFLVRESTLVKVAETWGVAKELKLGVGEVPTHGILADTVEAILGCIWLEAGTRAVKPVVEAAWGEFLHLKDEKDAKTRLQEWLQAKGLKLPVYETVEERGMDHDKWFKVRVSCSEGSGEGEGRSKQIAGLAAADELMKKLEN